MEALGSNGLMSQEMLRYSQLTKQAKHNYNACYRRYAEYKASVEKKISDTRGWVKQEVANLRRAAHGGQDPARILGKEKEIGQRGHDYISKLHSEYALEKSKLSFELDAIAKQYNSLKSKLDQIRMAHHHAAPKSGLAQQPRLEHEHHGHHPHLLQRHGANPGPYYYPSQQPPRAPAQQEVRLPQHHQQHQQHQHQAPLPQVVVTPSRPQRVCVNVSVDDCIDEYAEWCEGRRTSEEADGRSNDCYYEGSPGTFPSVGTFPTFAAEPASSPPVCRGREMTGGVPFAPGLSEEASAAGIGVGMGGGAGVSVSATSVASAASAARARALSVNSNNRSSGNSCVGATPAGSGSATMACKCEIKEGEPTHDMSVECFLWQLNAIGDKLVASVKQGKDADIDTLKKQSIMQQYNVLQVKLDAVCAMLSQQRAVTYAKQDETERHDWRMKGQAMAADGFDDGNGNDNEVPSHSSKNKNKNKNKSKIKNKSKSNGRSLDGRMVGTYCDHKWVSAATVNGGSPRREANKKNKGNNRFGKMKNAMAPSKKPGIILKGGLQAKAPLVRNKNGKKVAVKSAIDLEIDVALAQARQEAKKTGKKLTFTLRQKISRDIKEKHARMSASNDGKAETCALVAQKRSECHGQ